MQNEAIPSIHDKFFKTSMSDIQIATDFFKSHLPLRLQKKIDWSTLHLESGSFIEKKLKTFFTDILYSVKISGCLSYLYLLAEHKSEPEKFLPLTLCNYLCKIWLRELDKRKSVKEKLPVIYPVVFYHGERSPYPYSMSMLDCFENKKLAQEIYLKPFRLIDVTDIPDEELSKHGYAALMQTLQKHIRIRDICR